MNWSNSLTVNLNDVSAGIVGMPGVVVELGVMTTEKSWEGAGLTTSVLALVANPPTVAAMTVLPGWVKDEVVFPAASIVATDGSLDE